MKTAMKKRAWGFTLIELLVVISLIAVLAALLFPVFAQAREKARQAVCASNLRQIGMALQMYRADWDDGFPYGVSGWMRHKPDVFILLPYYRDIPRLPLIPDLLQPYLHSRDVFHCPSDVGSAFSDPPQLPTSFAFLGSSYDFDVDLGLRNYTDASIDPARHYYAGDSSGERHTYPGAGYFNEKGNVLFTDGHVKMTRKSDHADNEVFFAF